MDGLNFRRAFPRSLESLRAARKIVIDFARAWLRGEALVDFEIAIGEALANVLEHGAGDTFIVACENDGSRVVVEITNRSLGFQPPPGYERQPEIGAPRGYGIFLMHRLLDEVEYLENGTRLRLVKFMEPARTEHSRDDAC